MWVGSFQEKVDHFDGAGVQSTPSMQSMLKLGGDSKIDSKILDLVTFQPLKVPLNVGQKYVYSTHYSYTLYITIYIYIYIYNYS